MLPTLTPCHHVWLQGLNRERGLAPHLTQRSPEFSTWFPWGPYMGLCTCDPHLWEQGPHSNSMVAPVAAVQLSAWSVMRNDYNISLGNGRPGFSSLSLEKTRLASPNTACGGHFSPSTVERGIQDSWGDRD